MERNQTDRLEELLAESWAAYNRLHDRDFIVRPAIPILYFGDSQRYFESPLKVVTVGLNPSNAEFPGDDAFVRFPRGRVFASAPNLYECSIHRKTLDDYFRSKPYDGWFSSFEWILKGLGSSYYDGRESVALHTDLCSPFATMPTWSKLPKCDKSLLELDGLSIWHALLAILLPDIVFISVAERRLERIRFSWMAPWRTIWTSKISPPYDVIGRFCSIGESKPSLFVFGKASRKPFGFISKAEKPEIGATAKESYIAFER